MIRSFADDETRSIFEGGQSRRFQSVQRVAERKLQQLDSAARVDDLRAPPGNRLEVLRGDRDGQYSIRINDQYRLCFRWEEGEAHEVEICDYH